MVHESAFGWLHVAEAMLTPIFELACCIASTNQDTSWHAHTHTKTVTDIQAPICSSNESNHRVGRRLRPQSALSLKHLSVTQRCGAP
eukprot:520239-Pyramimonas_sp.AAC.1